MAPSPKVRLDLELVFPDLPAGDSQCRERLIRALSGLTGITELHSVPDGADTPAQLCVHYDPAILSLSRIQALVRAEGYRISTRYGHVVLATTVRSEQQAKRVSAQIRRLPGVVEAEAAATGFVRVGYDRQGTTEEQVRESLAELLGKEHKDDHGHDEHGHHGPLGERAELIAAGLAGLFLLAGYLVDTLTHAPPAVPMVLYLLTYLAGGGFAVREAFASVKAGRFEIDFLMLLAAGGAAVLGEWAEGGLLLVLFSLGHALEEHAMGRAKAAIQALAKLAPETASLLGSDGAIEEVAVETLAAGDLVVVRPHERFPTDGVVIKGESAVDQAPVTGESVPVDKRAIPTGAPRPPGRVPDEHTVFAGTINGAGALEVEVSQPASESTLARIVELVSEAETQRSPTQELTKRFERVFVPIILVLVIALLFAWVVLDETFQASFYRAMAVLVAASPCALAIATPSAVLSAIARGGRAGVLFKGGAPLELLGRVCAVAFDKTGTLTRGSPEVTDVVPFDSVEVQELLSVAAAVERLSDHPLARSVVDHAESLGLEAGQADSLEAMPGHGVRASFNAQVVLIGNQALFEDDANGPLPKELSESASALEAKGRTIMIVKHGLRFLGVLGLLDPPHDHSAAAVSRLGEIGVHRMVMLSGDSQPAAQAVAEQVGLAEARGALLPAEKLAFIRELMEEHEHVAMVGDGVNDAPALATATVGVAMGAAGSDVALETADVALMSAGVSRLPFAIELGRQTRATVRQNLVLSLGVVAILIPATLFGLGIGPAVALHEGSTLLVVLNALRLLRFGR
ncbi:MAG TPA: heavy metal translocating P-type ATPase [Planctomycetes bacterium]|nr:heavy metal translocating P-type ATPase [Planctomycetota bacterium]